MADLPRMRVISNHVTDMESHHSIRHSRKPHATRKLHGSIFHIEPELLPIEVLHCRNKNFDMFGSCDLHLDAMGEVKFR